MSDGTKASEVLRFEEDPLRVLGLIAASLVLTGISALIDLGPQ